MRRASICCLAVCFACVAAHAAEPARLEHYAPADAWLVIHSAGVAGADKAVAETGLGRIIHHPEVRALAMPYWKMLQDEINAQHFAQKFFTRLFMEPLTLSLRSRMDGQGMPMDWLLAVEAGPEGSDMRRRIDTFLTDIRKELPPEVVFTTERFRGTLITDVPLGDFTASYCYWQNKFLAGSSSMVVREQLSGDRKDITAHPDYKKLRARDGKQPVVATAFVNMEAMRAFVDRVGDRDGKRFVNSELMKSVGAASLTVSADGKDLRTRLTFTAGVGGQLGRFLDGKPVDEALLKMVPHDARMFYAARFKPAMFLDYVEAVIGQWGDEGELDRFRRDIAQTERELGLSIRNDLLGWDDGQFMVVLRRQPMLAMIPEVVLVARVADVDKLRNVEQALVMQLSLALGNQRFIGPMQPMVAVVETQWQGHTIRYLKAAGMPLPVSPAYVVEGNWMIASATLPGLKDYLLELKDGKSIVDTDRYKAVAGKLMTLPASVGYGDAEAGLRRFYGVAVAALTAGSAEIERETGTAPDLTKLPPVEQLAAGLGGSGWCTWRDDDVVGFEMVSPIGVPLFDPGSLDPIGAMGAGGGAGIAGTSMLAAMLLPTIGKSREAARRASSLSNLRQIGLASRMYADQNKNHFPDSFDTLVKTNYLDDPRVLINPLYDDQRVGYVLVTGFKFDADPSTILIYESRPTDDKRAVFRIGGEARIIPESQFQAQMKRQGKARQ